MTIQHFLALVVLSLAIDPGARAAVLAGPITNAANAHAYYLLSSNTWTASEAEAVELGGHLVTINDAAENQWVLNTFFPLTGVPYASLWIGLNDAANEGQFVWASGEPVAFTYWYPGEPNNLGGEDYASIRHPSEAPPTGSWNDLADTPNAGTFGVVEVTTPSPAVATQPADQFMPSGAQLNGQANPNGSPTLAWFEWGTSLAYGNVTPPQSVGSGSNAVGFSNVIVGLAIGTDYHFRARASNAFGSLAGLDQTFNLSNQLPVVTTLAADHLTTNSARLRGQVNPRGSPTAAWFEWGTDTNYGNVIGMQDVGQGSSVSNLNVVLNGLTTGTNYHYRLVATNALGAAYGANQTFNPGQRLKTNTWTGADPSGYWSAPANWSPTGVPFNGDDLVFPGGLPPADMVSTNDLPDGTFRSITFSGASRHTIRGNPMTLTNRADCIIYSGTNVIDCDLTFSGTPAVPPNPVFGTITIRGTFNSGELTLGGNVGGGSLVPYGNRLVLRGQFTGGSIRAYAGNLALYGDNPYPVTAEFKNGTLFIQGSQPNLNLQTLWEFESAACPYVFAGGVIGDVLGCGHIVLDSMFSVKSLGGPGASTYGWRVLDIRLNGTNVGEYGKLISSGDVTLSGASLTPTPGFNPQPGQVFTIIDKTSPGPITTVPGYDTNLFGTEGKIITLNGMPFRLSYVGGDGNDVTLTAQSTNTPPVVTWQQPANNAAFPSGFTISLRARATDSDGSVTNVEFFATPTNGPTINVGQGTLASDGYYVRGWTNPPPGQYQLHAQAVDNAGGLGVSDSVQIVVVGTNQEPNAQTRTWTGADPSGNWSAPANWSPAGALVSGDALVFPGGLPPADMVSTNDLTDRIFRSITFSGASRHTIRGNPITLTNPEGAIINGGTNVIACDLTFTGTPIPPTPATIRSSSFDSGELTVIGNVGAGSIYIGAGFWRLVIMGQFTGSFELNWYATLALYGDNPYAVSAVVVGSTLLVQGSQPNLNVTLYPNQEDPSWRASLSGDGVVGDVADFNFSSRITPDSTLSVKNIDGGNLLIHLNGTNAGEYGRLVASGNVRLGTGSLLPSPGFNPQPGQVFTIVDKTSPGPITGPITNAPFGPEGKIITLNGMPFRISYVGGDGNDLTLTAITPVPIVLGAPQQSFGTQFVFSYTADVGLRYAVDRSATLSNWTTLWSNTANLNPMTFTDTAATNGMNFYRVRLLPDP